MFVPKNYSAKVKLSNGLIRTQKDVTTPMPENDDGSGYTTENNTSWCYHNGSEHFKVMKITDNGWCASHYVVEDGEEILMRRLVHGASAQKAHRAAISKALERQ